MTDPSHSLQQTPNCWTSIGVWGDSTCAELATEIHCRNCPVYARMGRALLNRPAPQGYLSERAAILAGAESERAPTTEAVLVFRLGSEWFGLPASLCREILDTCDIHVVPHRSDGTFLGLVNVRGELLLCASLAALIGPDSLSRDGETESPNASPRMVAAEIDAEAWVFPCDEVDGVHRYHKGNLQDLPVTVGRQSTSFTYAILRLGDREVACLSESALATGLSAVLP